jgi:cation transport regulator
MPCLVSADLPASVRQSLPAHAQGVYRQAFNSAFATRSDDSRQEKVAHWIAWAAVKHAHVKSGDFWVARTG